MASRSTSRSAAIAALMLTVSMLQVSCPDGITIPTDPGGTGGAGAETFWVWLQAVGSTHGATTRCIVNGEVKSEGDVHGCRYMTGPDPAQYDDNTKYPIGTELQIEVSQGYLNLTSQIYVWNENQEVLVYDAQRDGYGDDRGMTYVIHYQKDTGLRVEAKRDGATVPE